MKVYTATINSRALRPTGHAFYARQRRLLVVVVLALAVIPLLGIGWISSRYYQESWERQTAADLENFAQARREIITLFLRDQTTMLSALTRLHSKDELAKPDRLRQLFDAMEESGVVVDLGVIDRTGRHLSYVGPYHQQLQSRNYAEADWFHEVLRNGTYVSDLFTGFRGVPHFVVAVTDPGRTWLLRATINSGFFSTLLDSANVGPGGDAFIVDRQGALQTASRRGYVVLPPAERETFMSAASQAVVRTDRFLAATAWLKGGDWLLVLMTDVEGSLRSFYQARNIGLAIIIIASALVVAIATLVVHTMVSQLEKAERERVAMLNQVREVEKMALVGRMAASVAHEINNPLQIIVDQAGWMGELLDEEDPATVRNLSEYRESLGKVRHHVKRASGITHRLLDFSRRSDASRELVDLNELAATTISFLDQEAKNSRIAIVLRLTPNLPLVCAEATQLEQVFLNILNNALDAIGQDGHITVLSGTTADEVSVAFADSGPGMPPETMARVFEPFFTTKEKGKGTGLGLAVSFNIMQRLGGTIRVAARPGGGCVFTVVLPRSPANAGRRLPRQQPETAGPGLAKGEQVWGAFES
ncbi:MAG: ATP-binding protein [Thermodesulfobacteriota bacterium]